MSLAGAVALDRVGTAERMNSRTPVTSVCFYSDLLLPGFAIRPTTQSQRVLLNGLPRC